MEAPEVRFEDVIEAQVKDKETFIYIDAKVLDGIECDTLTVIGSSSEPVPVGFSIDDDRIKVKLTRSRKKPIDVTMRISAIRKGFKGVRLSERTREEFVANEQFLRSAKPQQ